MASPAWPPPTTSVSISSTDIVATPRMRVYRCTVPIRLCSRQDDSRAHQATVRLKEKPQQPMEIAGVLVPMRELVVRAVAVVRLLRRLKRRPAHGALAGKQRDGAEAQEGQPRQHHQHHREA